MDGGAGGVGVSGEIMILHDLTSAEMTAVEATGTPCSFGRGELIIREGDAGSSFFLILAGRVEVRKNIDRDKYRKLVDLGPLDIFGEVCFLGVDSRSASVIAMADGTQCLEFQRDRFEQLMNRQPAIGFKLYRAMARELAQRLANVDADLKDALVWALGDMKTSVDANLHSAQKWTLRPPTPGPPTARIVLQ